jgi:hypothetical protein
MTKDFHLDPFCFLFVYWGLKQRAADLDIADIRVLLCTFRKSFLLSLATTLRLVDEFMRIPL